MNLRTDLTRTARCRALRSRIVWCRRRVRRLRLSLR
nr:MAG TPA: hypothetical protein [Caudoviricetes sp.]